jgi:hypothetical protein
MPSEGPMMSRGRDIRNMADFTSSDEEMGGGLGELARYQKVITEKAVADAAGEPKMEPWLSFASKRYFKSQKIAGKA